MYNEMENDILKVLFSQEDIARRVAEMGAELTERFQGKKPLFLGVLKGCFVNLAGCRFRSRKTPKDFPASNDGL